MTPPPSAVRPSVVRARTGHPAAQPLSPRERVVLGTLDEHRTLGEIAAELFVSRNTVKTQLASVYRKLGVSRRADAVAAARALGLG